MKLIIPKKWELFWIYRSRESQMTRLSQLSSSFLNMWPNLLFITVFIVHLFFPFRRLLPASNWVIFSVIPNHFSTWHRTSGKSFRHLVALPFISGDVTRNARNTMSRFPYDNTQTPLSKTPNRASVIRCRYTFHVHSQHSLQTVYQRTFAFSVCRLSYLFDILPLHSSNVTLKSSET